MNENKTFPNSEIDKYTYFAEQLSKKNFGEDFDNITPLVIEIPNLFQEYNKIEFKVILKSQSEIYLDLFLNNGKIIGYDFVTKE